MRHSVDYLYSLYDALVSINVPNDKARAVVDAMERDMGTTIATKADLQMLQIAAKSDLQLLRQDLVASLASRDDLATVTADIGVLRQEIGVLHQEIGVLHQDFGTLRQDNALIRKDLEILSTTMTVRLGSMLIVGLSVLFAALKLTE